MSTGLALDQGAGAVDLHEQILAGAGGPMQTIDILSNHHLHLAGLFKAHDGLVDDVGLGIAVFLPHLEFVVPVLHARLLTIHKILIINRLAGGPDAACTAKGGNAAGRGDACAGEDEDTAGFTNPVS